MQEYDVTYALDSDREKLINVKIKAKSFIDMLSILKAKHKEDVWIRKGSKVKRGKTIG